MFARHEPSFHLFLQGHPEYAADTLLREYRRDVGRYLRGERADYPAMPQGYFGGEAVDRIEAFRNRAKADRRGDLFAAFPCARWKPASSTTGSLPRPPFTRTGSTT